MISSRTQKGLAAAAVVVAAAGLLYLYREPASQTASRLWACLVDRERLQGLIAGFGAGAPLVFVLVQTAQVLLAPIPGEATGFVGGYLFGVLPGFLYSTIGLTLGSGLNLAVGRVLGRRYVRRMIPRDHLERFDGMLRARGLMVVFALFVFPGFPKDYLCLFLGMSRVPLRVLLVLAAVGRLPGTLLLSLQGALLFQRDYRLLAVALALFGGAAGLFYLNRARFYRWAESQNRRGPQSR